MKFIIHFLVLFVCARLAAQESDTLPRRAVGLGFVLSPDLSYRQLSADAGHRWLKDSYDTLEVARAACTAGAEIVFYPLPRLALRSGLLLSDRGERSKRYGKPTAFGYVNHYYYLSVPIRVSYRFLQRRLCLEGVAGLSADVLLGSRSTMRYGSMENPYPLAISGPLRRTGCSISAGVAMEAPLTQRWYFRLEPVFRYSLSNAGKGDLRRHLYSGGLQLGLFRRI